MSWKEWPSWVKGGIFGIGFWIWTIIMDLLIRLADSNTPHFFFEYRYVPLFFLNYIMVPWSTNFAWIESLLSILSFFIIGAFIGWIIGIIKKRKNVQ